MPLCGFGFCHLDKFDFVPFRGINESQAPAIWVQVGPVRVFDAEAGQVPSEVLKAVHIESEVSQIRLYPHWTSGRELAQLDHFLAGGRFQENEFRTARRLVPAHLFESEDVLIEQHGFFKVVHAISRVKKFSDLAHEVKIARISNKAIAQCRPCKANSFALLW